MFSRRSKFLKFFKLKKNVILKQIFKILQKILQNNKDSRKHFKKSIDS